MADAIGPGDFVECVEADASDGLSIAPGQVYTVASVWVSGGLHPCTIYGSCDFDGFELVGLPLGDKVWCAHSFRPIYRPKSTFIESLTQPAPSERERVDA